ncbi:lasso RiPP family leader peptide-containing protein [Actinomyces denticolens]
MSHASYTPPKMVVLGDFSDVTRCLWWGGLSRFSRLWTCPHLRLT